MEQSIECSHDLCQCTLMAEINTEAYCSETCKDAQESGTESETCGCGHPPCDVAP